MSGLKNNKLKALIILVLSAALVAFFILPSLTACGKEDKSELMRLHIRANSNEASDQAVKLKVRDKVVDFLESELKNISSLEMAKAKIEKLKAEIKSTADKVLKDNGFSYKSSVKVNNEFFPTRMYGDVVVESGYYDALIIELGSGSGDNWWCVIYPPLCYVDVQFGGDFRYKSKIKEIWDKYFG